MIEREAPRTEGELFADLEALCAAPGYIHAIAYFSQRDNMIRYSKEITSEDTQHLFSHSRLIRTEISTLIGLLLKYEIDFSIPSPNVMQAYIDRTEHLLSKLHESIGRPLFAHLDPAKNAEEILNPFASGTLLREGIFYGGDSAYNFQYRDLAVLKYGKDDAWLKKNKGFSIGEARAVVRAVSSLAADKGLAALESMKTLPANQWTLLPAHEFSALEVARSAEIDERVTQDVLSAFAVPEHEKNSSFAAITDFNVANAYPLIHRGENFIALQMYSLAEALYETPYYWMSADKSYVDVAMANRGRYTEEFSAERLRLIFGEENVHSNVDIVQSKAQKLGEIDVLVIFGNRAVVLQAKSKRLTLDARRGNDGQIQTDFRKSVQESYDQGLNCAKLLLKRSTHAFIDGRGREVAVPPLKEIYILCVVCDHYPALSFQAQQFLRTDRSESVPPPFVLDVFTLDAMTEMLNSPLRVLSYIDRRVKYSDKLLASHELTILSYHIKKNLWLSDDYDLFMLGDDICADLDLAMAARREGVPAKTTPDGVLTRLRDTTVGRIVTHIESRPEPGTIDLGFMLLTLGETSCVDISRGISKLAATARADGKNHDITASFQKSSTGLTIHCNDNPPSVSTLRLEQHCRVRKYSQKASTWFGVCLHPSDMSPRFGVNLSYPWAQSDEMDVLLKGMPVAGGLEQLIGKSRRRPRPNELCFCGSGKKYKKCCGGVTR